MPASSRSGRGSIETGPRPSVGSPRKGVGVSWTTSTSPTISLPTHLMPHSPRTTHTTHAVPMPAQWMSDTGSAPLRGAHKRTTDTTSPVVTRADQEELRLLAGVYFLVVIGPGGRAEVQGIAAHLTPVMLVKSAD